MDSKERRTNSDRAQKSMNSAVDPAELREELMLVTQIKADKNAGLEALVKRHYKQAYALALGMVGNRDDALDVTQEAFIRVQRSIHTFDETRRFFPWFYAILSNLSKTALTRRSRHSEREVELEYEDLQIATDPAENPEAGVLQAEQALQLRTALAKLSFEDREIITLFHFQDFSYDQIAEALSIPRGTVMSRLYYARKKLAQLLALYDADDNDNLKLNGGKPNE